MDTKACCNTGSGKKTSAWAQTIRENVPFWTHQCWKCLRKVNYHQKPTKISFKFQFHLEMNLSLSGNYIAEWQFWSLGLCKKWLHDYFYSITFVEVGCVTESPGIWVECEMDMASWSSSCTYIQHTPISIPRKFSIQTQQTNLQLQQTVFVWVPGLPNNPVLSAWFLWKIMIYLFGTHHYLTKTWV